MGWISEEIFMKNNIVLIGMMGSGKSTIGNLMSLNQPYEWIDTDLMIEKMHGRTIKDIFEIEGEEKFRTIETETLHKLKHLNNYVISTGGGIIAKKDNLALLKEIGIVVYLTASSQALENRIINDSDKRPMLKKHNFKTLLDQRAPLYIEAADIVICVEEFTPEQIIKTILKEISNLNETTCHQWA